MADVRQTVSDVLNQVLIDSGRDQKQFDDADRLMTDIGFDSLDLAVAVVALEKQTGKDPFREGTARARTFGEFVALYK